MFERVGFGLGRARSVSCSCLRLFFSLCTRWFPSAAFPPPPFIDRLHIFPTCHQVSTNKLLVIGSELSIEVAFPSTSCRVNLVQGSSHCNQ